MEEKSPEILSQLRKESPKTFRLERKSNPLPLRCWRSAVPTCQLGAGHIVSS